METNNLTWFIKQIGIPVTRQSIVDELQKHPHHSSLLAISDLLNNWHVPDAAYELAFGRDNRYPTLFINGRKLPQNY